MTKRILNPSQTFINWCITIIVVELCFLWFYLAMSLGGVFDISLPKRETSPPIVPNVEVRHDISIPIIEAEEVVEEDPILEPLEGRELYESYIYEICETAYPDIFPELIVAMVETESSFQPDAKNGHAIGLMQVDPRWQKERCNELGVYDISEPYANLLVGIDYLHDILDQTNWNTERALMIYNMGYKTAYKYYSQGIITKYAKNIISRCRELEVQS